MNSYETDCKLASSSYFEKILLTVFVSLFVLSFVNVNLFTYCKTSTEYEAVLTTHVYFSKNC